MIDRRYESGKSFVMYSKEELEAAQRTDMVTLKPKKSLRM